MHRLVLFFTNLHNFLIMFISRAEANNRQGAMPLQWLGFICCAVYWIVGL